MNFVFNHDLKNEERHTIHYKTTFHDIVCGFGVFNKLIVSSCDRDKKLISAESKSLHPLIQSACIAYAEHVPLVLAPDDIWFVILQNLRLIQEEQSNCESFVMHKEKKILSIDVSDYIYEGREFYEHVIMEYRDRMMSDIKKKYKELIEFDFTTSTKKEKICGQILFMNIVKDLYGFEMVGPCGIPSITLLGTISDWEKISKRVKLLEHFGYPKKCVDSIIGMVENIVSVLNGNKCNMTYWKRFFDYGDGCGGKFVNGHILSLFPYISTDEIKDGIRETQLRRLTNTTNFCYIDCKFGTAKFKLKLNSGFVGCIQDKSSLAVRPNMEWFVTKEYESKFHSTLMTMYTSSAECFYMFSVVMAIVIFIICIKNFDATDRI